MAKDRKVLAQRHVITSQNTRVVTNCLPFCWPCIALFFCPCISVFNQLDAQNLFNNKFYFMPLHVSSTCVHHQEVKIALHSLWYHHTYRWPSGAQVERWLPSGAQVERGLPSGAQVERGLLSGAQVERGLPSGAQVERGLPSGAQVERGLPSSLNLCTRRPPIGVMIPEAV
jgi:hypothetical protein